MSIFFMLNYGINITVFYRVLILILFAPIALAEPWMTGPLLAPAGRNTPPGHVNIEPYIFYSVYSGGYKNFNVTPIVTTGINDFLDIQATLPFDYNWQNKQNSKNIGDFNLALGLQLWQQNNSTYLPNIRFLLQEIFPTGRFEHLKENKLGTDNTGKGSYQTLMGLNFELLTPFKNEHYLRTRLGLTMKARSTDVKVHGINAYGGSTSTEGKVRLGSSYSVDFAFEYTLTQQLVPVFEVLFTNSSGSNFNGNPGFTPGGTLAGIGGIGNSQTSLAPAIEYNFTENLGIITGLWFSVSGPHSAKFTTAALAINYYI